MIFPEHMEFRYYITPERKECFALYDKTLGSRMTYLDQTQDLGQCLIDLYDADFYAAYCVLSEINKLVQTEKVLEKFNLVKIIGITTKKKIN